MVVHIFFLFPKIKGNFLKKLLGHSNWVRCLLYEPTNRKLWSGGDEGVIRIWDPDDHNSADSLFEISAHQSVRSMALG